MALALPLERALRREVLFALLAVLSVLIGFSRLAGVGRPPVWMQVTDVAIALAFLLDWVSRVLRAPQRGRYALRHAYEAVTFIPFTLIPAAEGANVLRGVRFVRLARFLRFLRFGAFAKVGLGVARLPRRLRYLQRVVEHAQLVTLVIVGIVLVSAGAAGILIAEGRANPAVPGYGAAFWWSLNLFTTVAYAVPAPVTSAGHVVSGIIMVAGIAYVGVLTASLASALLRTPDEDEEGEA